MRHLTREHIESAADAAVDEVLTMRDYERLYALLVGVQFFRYTWRKAVYQTCSALPFVPSMWMKQRALQTALEETKRIALMRDLCELPSAPGPFNRFKQERRFVADSYRKWKDLEAGRMSLSHAFATLPPTYQQAAMPLYEPLTEMMRTLPPALLSSGFYGKLARTTCGVVGYCLHHDASFDLSRAIQLGFWFGVLYLYDDALDMPHITSTKEKVWLKRRLRRYFQNPAKPGIGRPVGPTSLWISRALEHIATLCPPETHPDFYVCLESLAGAIDDEAHAWPDSERTIYRRLAIKSGMTRVLPATLAGRRVTPEFLRYSLITGIANQLIDDLRDFPEDAAAGTPTPYVHYARGYSMQHPLRVYFKALETSTRAFGRMPWRVRILWSLRCTHGLRVLALKTKSGQRPPLEGPWNTYLNLAGFYESVIFDLEGRLAQKVAGLVGNILGKKTTSVVSH